MVVELPADAAIGVNAIWGEGGFSTQFIDSTTRLAPRRVRDLVTTVFNRYHIFLAGRVPEAVPIPTPADITRQPPRFKG